MARTSISITAEVLVEALLHHGGPGPASRGAYCRRRSDDLRLRRSRRTYGAHRDAGQRSASDEQARVETLVRRNPGLRGYNQLRKIDSPARWPFFRIFLFLFFFFS